MQRENRRLAVIVAADIAGYFRLIGWDEEGTMCARRAQGVQEGRRRRGASNRRGEPAPVARRNDFCVDQGGIAGMTIIATKMSTIGRG